MPEFTVFKKSIGSDIVKQWYTLLYKASHNSSWSNLLKKKLLISKLPDKHYITHNHGQLEKSLFSGERKLQRLLLVPMDSMTSVQSCASTSEKVFSLFKFFLMLLEKKQTNKKNNLNLNDLDIILQNIYCEKLVWKGIPFCVQVMAHKMTWFYRIHFLSAWFNFSAVILLGY